MKKRIVSVYNLHGAPVIWTGTDSGTENFHRVDLSSTAQNFLFKLLIRFLDVETMCRRGFYFHSTAGWFWLRRQEASQ